ncbi:hypothetical protein ACNFBR_26690 [Pseudomonas sp. NY11955]|uniref:hypothetical protein n=1 Tax=Pseudomonas sp. NY11955 TaxID=3400363 RepID=UPI003A889F4A
MISDILNFEGWPVVMRIYFLITPFAISLLGVSINLHVTLTRDFHVVCSSITSNPYIERLKVCWGASSLKWRFMLVCSIGGLVTFPQLALRFGKLDIEELRAFPPKLKRRLGISVWLSIIAFAWMVLAVAVIELSKEK